MLHYRTGTTISNEEMISNEQKQQQQRERSLSPDSLEQRLFKQQILVDDVFVDDDEDESFLSSSSSLIDSISIDPQLRQSNSTRTLLKTFTSHGLLSTLTFPNDNNNNDDDIDDDDDDDDLDEIHIDQDEVNLLFSDPDDGVLCRLSSELIDADDDYDDNDDNDEFCRHIRPLPLVTSSDLIIPSLISLHEQDQQQYSPYHFLDPISEAASEEERRAAISIIRQQQKHKHSTSSSLSISANGHCDGDTTANDDLSTLSDIDEQNISMDENSTSQTSPRCYDQQQHVHKKRRHTEIRSMHWSTKNGSKLITILLIVVLNTAKITLNKIILPLEKVDDERLVIELIDKEVIEKIYRSFVYTNRRVLCEVYIEIVTRYSKEIPMVS